MTEAREQPLAFGPGGRLVGVLSEPPAGTPALPLACLLLNVGVTHRIGPRRLNVKLARRLPAAGVSALRFDLSGIGDSAPAAAGGGNFRDQSLRDLQAAMDEIERRTGIRRCALLGICSGAVHGYWLAQADPRVVGLMMFDGFAYPTARTRWRHDWTRLRSLGPAEIAAKLVGRLRRAAGGAAAPPPSIFGLPDQLTPSRAEYAAALDALAARGVALYLAYSGSILVAYNYREQLHDAFAGAAFVRQARIDYWPDIDHLVTPLAAQRRWLDAVGDWTTQLARGGETRVAAPRTAPASARLQPG